MAYGWKDYGFRQAMADIGGFVCSPGPDVRMHYILYQTAKFEKESGSNREWVLPYIISNCTAYKWQVGYSNPLIYFGETKTVNVSIDEFMGRLTAEVDHNSNTSVLEFSLYTPNGTKITKDNYNSFQGVNYSTNDTYMVYTVDNPDNGNWTLELKAIDVPSDGEWYYMQGYTGTMLTADIDRGVDWYFKGDNVKILFSPLQISL